MDNIRCDSRDTFRSEIIYDLKCHLWNSEATTEFKNITSRTLAYPYSIWLRVDVGNNIKHYINEE
jgi:hypothetical protein